VIFRFFPLNFGPITKLFGVRLIFGPQNVYLKFFSYENFKKVFKQKSLRKIQIDEFNTFKPKIVSFKEFYFIPVRNYHF
jgi:hypothetical protein